MEKSSKDGSFSRLELRYERTHLQKSVNFVDKIIALGWQSLLCLVANRFSGSDVPLKYLSTSILRCRRSQFHHDSVLLGYGDFKLEVLVQR